MIGKYGRSIAELQAVARGDDESGIETRTGFRSVSREVTFDQDTSDVDRLNVTLDMLAQDLSSWCAGENVFFRTITVKLRYEGFSTRTRARTFTRHTSGARVIRETAWHLFRDLYDGRNIRLIGVRLSGIRSGDRKQKCIGEFLSPGQN